MNGNNPNTGAVPPSVATLQAQAAMLTAKIAYNNALAAYQASQLADQVAATNTSVTNMQALANATANTSASTTG